MSRITINLLPVEFRIQELKRAKFYKIQSIGIAIIISFIFISALSIVLRILQSQSVSEIANKLDSQQKRVIDLKNTQASLILLKNRLITIEQYLGVSSRSSEVYKLLANTISPSISISSVDVNKIGEVTVLAATSNIADLDDLINKIAVNEGNMDKFIFLSVDSLSRSSDGIYRLSLRLKAK